MNYVKRLLEETFYETSILCMYIYLVYMYTYVNADKHVRVYENVFSMQTFMPRLINNVLMVKSRLNLISFVQ